MNMSDSLFHSLLKGLCPWLYGEGKRPDGNTQSPTSQTNPKETTPQRFNDPEIKKTVLLRINNSKDGRHPTIIIDPQQKTDKEQQPKKKL
jgi:hypothetical protein